MSNINKEFTAADAPRMNRDKEAWARAQTERWKAVAFDGDQPIAAEELHQRALNKLSPKARRGAGLLYQMPQEVVAEVLAAFNADGSLKIPFTAAK